MLYVFRLGGLSPLRNHVFQMFPHTVLAWIIMAAFMSHCWWFRETRRWRAPVKLGYLLVASCTWISEPSTLTGVTYSLLNQVDVGISLKARCAIGGCLGCWCIPFDIGKPKLKLLSILTNNNKGFRLRGWFGGWHPSDSSHQTWWCCFCLSKVSSGWNLTYIYNKSFTFHSFTSIWPKLCNQPKILCQKIRFFRTQRVVNWRQITNLPFFENRCCVFQNLRQHGAPQIAGGRSLKAFFRASLRGRRLRKLRCRGKSWWRFMTFWFASSFENHFFLP